MRELYELKGKGRSIRGIADDLGISRATVRKYVRSPGVPKPKPRVKRGSKLDAYKEYIDVRLAEGLENCVVLLREIRELGYDGGYSTLMLVSWDHLLHRLAMRVPEKADEGTLRSIAELQGVIEYEALNAFQAPSKNLIELDEANKERFKEFIDGAIAQGRRENWASTKGFTVGHSVTGYVRNFAIGEVTMWFGYDLRMWERYGRPLWVGFQEAAQNNIGAVREGLKQLCARRPENFYHDVPAWSQKRDFIRIEMPSSGEFPKLLGALVAQLHEIAHALQRVELSGSNPGE